jgi:hypothetical protein
VKSVSESAPRTHPPRLVAAGLLVLWLLSLALPTYLSAQSAEWGHGGTLLLALGWLGILGVGDSLSVFGTFAWWANPLFLWATARILLRKALPAFSAYLAGWLSFLALLVGSLKMNEAPTYSAVLAYGPGVLAWLLAILGLACTVAREAKSDALKICFGLAMVILSTAYLVQVGSRAFLANETEKNRLPFYAAKRGVVCAEQAIPLPIDEKQHALALEAPWMKVLNILPIDAVQYGGYQYRRAPGGSPESRMPPFSIREPISTPARYVLRIEGSLPYEYKSRDLDEDFVMRVIDNSNDKEIGHLAHRREFFPELGFCPSLTSGGLHRNEEAQVWLAPFISGSGVR